MAQTIFRVAYRHKPYSQLGNAMLKDLRLSPTATGILVFILAHPPNWQFNVEWLQKARSVSRKVAQKAIREHISAGYCQRHRGKRPDGTWLPYEYLFTDEPHRNAALNLPPQAQNGPVVYEPRDQKPRGGKGTPTKKVRTPKKRTVSRENLPVGDYAHTRERLDDGREG